MRLVDIECDAVTERIGRIAFKNREDIQNFLDTIPSVDVENTYKRLYEELHVEHCDLISRIKNVKSEVIKDILETLKAEAWSSDKYLREYDNSKEQKAYNQALWKACRIVQEILDNGGNLDV